jgi:hypothetical protein
MKRNVCKAMLILFVLTLLISCATIIGKSSPENLDVRSIPEKATVVITDEKGTKILEGVTPTMASLEKKGFFRGKKYTIKISKQGFADQVVTVYTKINGWYILGNFVFGPLAPIAWLIVDPVTGAMWSLDTNEVVVTLESSQQSKLTQSFQLGILLSKDVPQPLRDKMVKIYQRQ